MSASDAGAARRPARTGDLAALDETLVRLRRLWSASRTHVVDDLGERVEMSSVLVVEACARADEGDGAAGGPRSETTVGDVAGFLDVEASTASRMVDRAVRAGLVVREASEVDARRSALRLTDAGRGLRRRAVAARLAWLDGVVADWPGHDVRTLVAVLSRFAGAVERAPQPGSRRPGGGRG